MRKYRTRDARQEDVLLLALDEPALSVRAMAKRLELSKDTVRRDLAELRRDRRLVHRDPERRQLAEVSQAITSLVPGEPGDRVVVSVTHHYTQPGRPSLATWTGTPEGLAERILSTLTLPEDQADRIAEAVRAALAPASTGGAP